jgi:hypothetical protein
MSEKASRFVLGSPVNQSSVLGSPVNQSSAAIASF